MDAARIEPEQAAPAKSRPPAAAADIPASHAAMSSRALAVLIACGVLGVALLAGVKREAIGDFVRFQIDAQEATERGDEDLRQIKIDPATYHHATTITYTFDDYTNEYLRRAIGIAAANRIYRDQVPSAFWTVRYFRDSQNEEYLVVLKPDGSLHSMHHTLDEKAPGANLSKEEAQARAEAYLRDRKGVNLADWNLVETHTDKKPARTDHTFEWEQKAALDAPGQPGAAGRAHPHAIAGAGRRSFRLPHFHQDSRNLARCGKPHHPGATRADVWQRPRLRRRAHRRAGDFPAQPEKSGRGPRSVAHAREMVDLGCCWRRS